VARASDCGKRTVLRQGLNMVVGKQKWELFLTLSRRISLCLEVIAGARWLNGVSALETAVQVPLENDHFLERLAWLKDESSESVVWWLSKKERVTNMISYHMTLFSQQLHIGTFQVAYVT